MHTLLLRTMTLAETGHSTGEVSLSSLLDGGELPLAESALGLPELVSRVVAGGWPGWFNLSERSARSRADSYVQDIVEHEFATVAGRRGQAG